ncbi:MAG TPA: N-acetyltransferase [Jatrophihabitantaceae bacterium]|jgi:putative acetyltransferase|nr:N-acetyltransferase [Jatrophihabitantaceae bacterium]
MRVREQRPEDWPAVRELIDRAFAPAANAGLLAEWVHENSAALSLVAEPEQNGPLVGQALFGVLPLHTPDGARDVLCLAPLSVAPEFRGQGLARKLVTHGLAALQSRPEPFVVLEGDPAMYARFGFRPASEFGLERPSELIPEPAFQAVALPAHRPGLTGRVEYPQYFFDIGAVGP